MPYVGLVILSFLMTGCLESSQKAQLSSEKPFHHESYDEGDSGGETIQDLNEVETASTNYSNVTYSPEKLGQAVQRAANTLLQRFATAAEVRQARQGFKQYSAVIESYVNSPRLLPTMKRLHNNFMGMAGTMKNKDGSLDGINYDEPTNMILYIIKNNRDYREAVTANYCINDALQVVSCDSYSQASQASQNAAGILTTRAFLSAYANHYNFARVNAMQRIFSCSKFPDKGDPGMTEQEVSDKVKSFNCSDCDPQCVQCHRVINARSVPFYNYNWKGKYVVNTYNSTTNDSDEPSDTDDLLVPGTQPRYYGKPVTTVRDMAKVLIKRPEFRNCMVQRLTNFLLGRDEMELLPDGMRDLYDGPAANSYRVKEVLKAGLTHPLFINK